MKSRLDGKYAATVNMSFGVHPKHMVDEFIMDVKSLITKYEIKDYTISGIDKLLVSETQVGNR